jgi:hypothetical protein
MNHQQERMMPRSRRPRSTRNAVTLWCAAALAASQAFATGTPLHVSIVAPVEGVTYVTGEPLGARGQVLSASEPAVKLTVRNAATGRFLRADGSWGRREWLPAAVAPAGSGAWSWSLAITPMSRGRHQIVLRARDAAHRARAVQYFLVDDEAPDDGPPGGGPPNVGFGEIVARCPYTHSRSDDPIVFPGQPGVSHLHSFFGAATTDAFSTAETLLDSPTSCDPLADHSAYWVPTLFVDELAIEPEQATFYYTNNETTAPTMLQTLPFGLRIIAGDPRRTGPNDGPSRYKWSCRGAPDSSTGDFVVCPAGHEFELLLDFPTCWNGNDLDSADHRSHMAYAAGKVCPASHPVAVPRLQFKLRYPTSGGPGVSLATGSGDDAHHDGHGWTIHGDFFNAWEPAELERRVEGCLRRGVKYGTDGLPLP